jgi:hypothetical protein
MASSEPGEDMQNTDEWILIGKKNEVFDDVDDSETVLRNAS